MSLYYQPTKIHAGVNAIDQVGEIVKKYGKRCFLVTTADEILKPLYEKVKKNLTGLGIEVIHYDGALPNPTTEIVEIGVCLLKESPCDVVLAVGGGSSIDSAKAIAFLNQIEDINWEEIFQTYHSPFDDYELISKDVLPLISIPTTAGTGSQVTQAAVLSKGKEKITFFHPCLFSKECILDPTLMKTLPARISASTGFDAFTHAFESYINPNSSFLSRQDSLKAMRVIIEILPKVLVEPDNLELRMQMSFADTLAGRALANAGAAVPHPLSEIIGGICKVAHGEALAVVYPSFIKHTHKNYKEPFNEVANLFNNIYGDKGYLQLEVEVRKFLSKIGLKQHLKELDVEVEVFQEILDSPTLTFLPFGGKEALQNILRDAY